MLHGLTIRKKKFSRPTGEERFWWYEDPYLRRTPHTWFQSYLATMEDIENEAPDEQPPYEPEPPIHT